MKQEIADYLRACYPALYLISHEERRAERILIQATRDASRRLWVWSATEGLDDREEKKSHEIYDAMAVLEFLSGIPSHSLVVLKDFHLFLDPAHPIHPTIIRKLKDVIRMAKARDLCVCILSARKGLPADIEKLFVSLAIPLPDKHELEAKLREVCENNGVILKDRNQIARLRDAAAGLSEEQAENAFALSLAKIGTVDEETIAREKSRLIAIDGILEVVEEEIPVDHIGGLDLLKEDLVSKSSLWSLDAWNFGITPPRGMLVVGQPGTGKSLTAKALKTIFGIPLLRLEAGRLFGSYIGQSESNWRSAFETARASSPCILWVDEADGLFAGSESSGKNDSGTTQRVIKAILQDMQESSSGIFYCFTANDIDHIPDPVIDRLETWSVDLPNKDERMAIWKIHIAKVRGAKGWNPDVLTPEVMEAIVNASEGFSGRQIEMAWEKSLTVAFNAHREPTSKDILASCHGMVPTSVTMASSIEERRSRLRGRCRPATSSL
jgi:SpoVK/Ycf46/Vps4 family AAA+-type ATPase